MLPVSDPMMVRRKDGLRQWFLLDTWEFGEPVCVLSKADRATVALALNGAGMLIFDSKGCRPYKSPNGFMLTKFANKSKMSQTQDRLCL